jgi:hypothetical protein
MKKLLLPALAIGAALVGGAAMAHPYGGHGGYHSGRHYRDSDRDGVPDRVEWNRDRDRDGRPDQWDRRDNRRHRHHYDRYHSRYDRHYHGYRY